MTDEEIHKLQKTVDEIQRVVTILEEQSRPENCPMRVDIARAGNGVVEARREAREAEAIAVKALKVAHANEVGLAKVSLAAGSGTAFVAVIVAIANYLL